MPPDLIDNAAILGTFSIIAALLFLMDLAAPQLKLMPQHTQTSPHVHLKPLEIDPDLYNLNGNGKKPEIVKNGKRNGLPNGQDRFELKPKETKKPKHFNIYGSDKDDDSVAEMPVEMQRHSPVFSKIHRPIYGQYDNLSPSYLKFPVELENVPNSPGEPGYVQYTAKKWGQHAQKAPRSSPTDV